MKVSAALLLAALFATPRPALAQVVAVTNARIHTAGPAGEIAKGTVLIRDGRIAEVGAAVAVPPGARVIDAAGKTVTPGLVASNTTLSLTEIDAVPQTTDFASASPSVTAAFDVQYGVNPDSTLIPVARLGGVTRAVIAPNITARGEGGEEAGGRGESLFAGLAAVIHLGGGDRIVVKPKVAALASLGEEGADIVGGSRGAALVALASALEDVRHYAANRAAFDRAGTRSYALSRADLEALLPVVRGQTPLMIHVSRASDILQVLQLGREAGLKLIVLGGEEAWLVGRELAAARVPVVLEAAADLPTRFETTRATLENAARLHRNGVRVVISGDRAGHYARRLRLDAGNAVVHGLPWAEALKAITLNPALVFGMADRFGSIEPGKEADLAVWSGDPFEPLTRLETVMVAGREMPLTSRQIQLQDRYIQAHGLAAPQARR